MATPNQPSGNSIHGKPTRTADPVEATADHSSSTPSTPLQLSAGDARIPEGSSRYQITDEIARGGMGVIYRATDTSLGREVAVKMLAEHYSLESSGARRFADEARITAQLQHPAIPPVHDLGVLPNGRPFLAMKLIKGQTLFDLLERRPDPKSDHGRFVAIFEQVCQAVGYAHAHHVVHRDLKPANVMVGSFGEVQVMDWGLAKVLTGAVASEPDNQPGHEPHATVIQGSDSGGSDVLLTQMGSVLGTLPYMPPEQAAGEITKIGAASDVFSLGAILAVIITGEPPYAGKNAEAVRVMAVRGDLTDCRARLEASGAEPELVALCQRCLAFDPADRPRDGGAVAREVARFRTESEERALAAEKEYAAAEVKISEQKAKRRWQRAVAAAVVLILSLIGGGAWWLDREAAEREQERAVATERDRHEAAAVLTQAEASLADGDLPATDRALSLAQERMNDQSPPGLINRLATAIRDRDFIRTRREIESSAYVPGAIGTIETAEVAKRFQNAFATYGLDVGATERAVAANAVRNSRISLALLASLSEWFCADPKADRLCELLDQLDPEPDRVAIRNAIHTGDKQRVHSLVSALNGSTVPAWFASSVGFQPIVPQDEGVRLMEAAWRVNPSDFMLAYRCSRRLWGTGRNDEMLSWAKVAVALQPESPFAHSALASGWAAKHNWEEAEESAHRSIELGRKQGIYHGPVVLGFILLEKGDLDGAEANYQEALALNPHPNLYFNLGVVGQRRGDILGAESWFRKAIDASPTGDPHTEHYQQIYDNTVEVRDWQEKVADGHIEPPNLDSALGVIALTKHPSKRQYLRAVTLYSWVFERDSAKAGDLDSGLRRDAAFCAVMAAAGKDKGAPHVEPAERHRLLDQALAWLRADLALMKERAPESQWTDKIRKWLTQWKENSELEPVRGAESLAQMEPDHRAAWQGLWRDVDAVCGTIDNKR